MIHLRLKITFLIVFIILTAVFETGCKPNIPLESGIPGKTAQKEISLDLKGRTIRITYPIAGGGAPSATNPNNDIFTKMLFERVTYVENKYNCKIVFSITSSGTNDYVNEDILYKPTSDIPGLSAKKAILPLDDYLDYSGEILGNNAYGLFLQDGTVYNDLHYGIDISNSSIKNASMLRYNKTLIKSKGLQDPLDLMIEGNWTWEAFLKIAEAVRTDIDGDGQDDILAVIPYFDTSFLYDFILSNNAGYYKNVNGKNTYSLDEPNSIEAVSFVQSLYNTYKVAASLSALPRTGSSISKMIQNAVFQSTSSLNFTTVDGVEYGTVMFPKGPKSDRYIVTNAGTSIYTLSSTAQNPEIVARLMFDLFVFWDPAKDVKMTRDDYLKNYVLNGIDDPVITEKILNFLKQAAIQYKGPYSMMNMYIYDSTFNKIIDSVIYKNEDAQTVLKQLKDSAQILIDQKMPLP